MVGLDRVTRSRRVSNAEGHSSSSSSSQGRSDVCQTVKPVEQHCHCDYDGQPLKFHEVAEEEAGCSSVQDCTAQSTPKPLYTAMTSDNKIPRLFQRYENMDFKPSMPARLMKCERSRRCLPCDKDLGNPRQCTSADLRIKEHLNLSKTNLEDFEVTKESEVLRCRSSESQYSLRALKAIPNYNVNGCEIINESKKMKLSTYEEETTKPNSISQVESDNHINRLPNEILSMILSHIPHTELLKSCLGVCHRWSSVVRSHTSWKSLSFCTQAIPVEDVCVCIKFSPKLKSITIKDRDDVDIILPVLHRNCKYLENLELIRCCSSDGCNRIVRAKYLYPFLRKAPLHSLNLKGTDFKSRKLYEMISTHPNLKKLNISYSKSVTPQMLSEIAKNTHLKVLKNKWHLNSFFYSKSFGQLNGKIDDWASSYNLLFQNTALTTLEFYAVGIEDTALSGLALCKNLKKLCIYNANCFGDKSMDAVGSLTQLEELLIHNAKVSTAAVANAFQKGNLSELHCLHFNNSITAISADISTDGCVALVAEKCKELRHVSFTNCRKLTDTGVQKVLTHCSNLQSLDVNGCIGIRGLSFLLAPKSTPKLNLLVVEENCSKKKNHIVKFLASKYGITVKSKSTWKNRTKSFIL